MCGKIVGEDVQRTLQKRDRPIGMAARAAPGQLPAPADDPLEVVGLAEEIIGGSDPLVGQDVVDDEALRGGSPPDVCVVTVAPTRRPGHLQQGFACLKSQVNLRKIPGERCAD